MNDALENQLAKWQKNHAQYAQYDSMDQSITLRGIRSGAVELSRLPDFSLVRKLRLIESTLSLDWFKLIQEYVHIESVVFEDAFSPPDCKLPDHVHDVSFRLVPTGSVATLLKSNMANLTHVTLKEVEFNKNLETIIKKLDQLHHLDLESTKPPGPLGEKPHLTHLRLSQLELESNFVNWVEQLHGLTHIEFVGTGFTEITSSFIKNAKTLIIRMSEITQLPEYKGKSLECLALTNVDLTEIPVSFMQATLKSLELSRTNVYSLPTAIETLGELEELALQQCKITQLPKQMACTAKLKKLDLSSLPITSLPEWLKEATNLEYLDICDCHLIDIPERIALPLLRNSKMEVKNARGQWEVAPNAQGFYIKGLRIQGFDPRYLTSGYAKQLLPYFYKSQKRPGHEATLFVVGADEYRRRKAIRALLDEDIFDEERVEGHGVATLETGTPELAFGGVYFFDDQEKRLPNDLRLHIHDVISGIAYDVAHPTFFLDSCLYLVLIDSESGRSIYDQAKYFLYSIEQKAPHASIVFCVTSDNENQVPFSEEHLLKSLNGSLSCATCAKVMPIHDDNDSEEYDEFQKIFSGTVFSMIERLPIMKWQIPVAWMSIRKDIESRFRGGEDHIGFDVFRKLCEYYLLEELNSVFHGINAIDPNFLTGILQWLKESGVIFFPLEGTSQFPNTIFNSQWVKQCVYGILHYARQTPGLASLTEIWEMADEKIDEELLDTEFVNHPEPLLNFLQNAGLGIASSSGIDARLLFPLFRSILAPTMYSSKTLSPYEIRHWLTNATAPTGVTNRHYVIDLSVLTEEFYSSFLHTLHKRYQRILEAWGLSSSKEACWCIGREGGLFAFPPKDDDREIRSGSLLVMGVPGSPARMHIYASGATGPTFPSHWQHGRSHHILAYATMALNAFRETLSRHQILEEGMVRHVIYFEETLGDESTLIPLEDIKAYKEAGRSGYYCAPLKKLFDVKRIFETTYPNPVSEK